MHNLLQLLLVLIQQQPLPLQPVVELIVSFVHAQISWYQFWLAFIPKFFVFMVRHLLKLLFFIVLLLVMPLIVHFGLVNFRVLYLAIIVLHPYQLKLGQALIGLIELLLNCLKPLLMLLVFQQLNSQDYFFIATEPKLMPSDLSLVLLVGPPFLIFEPFIVQPLLFWPRAMQ